MSELQNYKNRVDVVTNPDPAGAGGLVLTNNFRALADADEAIEDAIDLKQDVVTGGIGTIAGFGSEGQLEATGMPLQAIATTEYVDSAIGAATTTPRMYTTGLIDFTTVASHALLYVPAGHIFIRQSMTVTTDIITTPGTTAVITVDPTILPATNEQGKHEWEGYAPTVPAETSVTAAITTASTAATHQGRIFVVGYLIPV